MKLCPDPSFDEDAAMPPTIMSWYVSTEDNELAGGGD